MKVVRREADRSIRLMPRMAAMVLAMTTTVFILTSVAAMVTSGSPGAGASGAVVVAASQTVI